MRPIVHIVPHTHWDREWYHPAARFQLRLARLAARVLDLLESGALPAFLLDGQGIVLDDVLEVRPDLAPRLRHQLKAGRLEAGPWYVLADNLTVSGEAIVRNLIEGGRAVGRYDGKPMAVGYAPDAFGHPAILPTILAGFGIETAITWRGFGGEKGQEKDLYRWSGPDGSEVLMIHLPKAGYEYGSNLSARRLKEVSAMLKRRARSPHLLVMNGADHHAAQENLTVETVKTVKTVKVGGLTEYTSAVLAWSKRNRAAIPEIAGELRDGRRHAWALQGTFGTRLYLKQQNAECQRLLERIAEPLAALALTRGVDLRAELSQAWRTLLANHAHDSICGTSADAAHREMVTRFARAKEQAIEIAQRAMDVVTGRDADAARVAGRAAWQPRLLVFNPVAWSGGRRLVEAEVALFRGDIPVGPGSAGKKSKRRTPGVLVLRDAAGHLLPHQELSRSAGEDLVEAPGHYPDCDEVEWRRVLFMAEDLPALGVTHVSVEEGPTPHAPLTTHRVTANDTSLENEYLALRIESDGTIAVLDRKSGESYHGLGALIDEADVGDSYTPALRGVIASEPDHVAVRVVHPGPLRGVLEVVRRYDAASLEVTMFVALEARSRLIGLAFEGVNVTLDHRLRIAFPTGARSPRVLVDGPFGDVERTTKVPRPRKGDTEMASPTAPMQRWVAAAKGKRGLVVVTDGLPQYEVRPDGMMLITLLRATGAISKHDLKERPGHAGWPVPAHEGQCIGPFAGRMAVRLAREADLDSRSVGSAADAFLLPPVARMQRAMLHEPDRVHGAMLEGGGLGFSVMKPAESGQGVVLRCYNGRPETVQGTWYVPWRFKTADRCRLDETPLSKLTVSRRGVITFAAAPREIVTIRIR